MINVVTNDASIRMTDIVLTGDNTIGASKAITLAEICFCGVL